MKVDIQIEEAMEGRFSNIQLSFEEPTGEQKDVDLFVDFAEMYEFTHDTQSIYFDFFLITVVVYGIDNLLSRESYSFDGWAREIEATFPVINLRVWKGREEQLEKVLKFLTGDLWKINFQPLETKRIYQAKSGDNKPSSKYQISNIKALSLFSGGLDSLIGVIDALEKPPLADKIVLASHFDFHSKGPNADQERLFNYLSQKYPERCYWIQSTVTLSRKDHEGQYISTDTSYRSRSILFIGIAAYLMQSLSIKDIIIPENGTISLNYPLSRSRASSLSTRTTHPYVTAHLQSFLQGAGIPLNLINPYSFQTKGEMVKGCLNSSVLEGIYDQSVSCGKRHHNFSWHNRKGTSHCGKCMPCIYRRAALHRKGWDHQLYGVDILNVTDMGRSADLPALFSYLNTPLSKEKIKRNLLVYGSLPLDQLDAYAEVIDKSRKELLKWFKDKGNAYVKQTLGLS